MAPINNAVDAPTNKIKSAVNSVRTYSGDSLPTINIPAVTIVAAWIKADIGVGPSIESGSHTCKGICADFAIAPINKNKHKNK